MIKLIHYFNRKKCLNHAIWKDGKLICKICKNELGFRYRIGRHIYVFVHEDYKKLEQEILEKKNENINGDQDFIAEIEYSEYTDLITNLKGWSLHVLATMEEINTEENFKI